MKAIEIKCEAAETVPVGQIMEFQGELKSLSDRDLAKLKRQITKQGFSFPLFVWRSELGDFCLDGHQRLKALKSLRDDGYEVPDVPVAIIQAETYREAKEKLLAAASQYGKVEQQGLFEFIEEAKIPFEYLYETTRLPEIDYDGFKDEFYKELTDPEDVAPKESEDREPKFTEYKLAGEDQAQLINGDCLEALKNLGDNEVDALVTDPPAGISFMGKAWDDDKGGRDEWIKWLSDVMAEALRVMKPGAHGLVWALPRTSHWTATAVEDAGFEIRDCLSHLFGSGFPKSARINLDPRFCQCASPGHSAENKDLERLQTCQECGKPDANGFGTALKPAQEMWWLIRKPLSEKTVASNVLKHGTGGINVDGCRVSATDFEPRERIGATKLMEDRPWTERQKTSGDRPKIVEGNSLGRFPANLVLSHNPDCELVGTREVKAPTTTKFASNGQAKHTMGSFEEWDGSYRNSNISNEDGTETIPEYRCTEFTGDVPFYEGNFGSLWPFASLETLLDHLGALLGSVHSCSKTCKIPLPHVFETYGTEDIQSKTAVCWPESLSCVVARALALKELPGFQVDCSSCLRLCDERLHSFLTAVQEGTLPLYDVLLSVHSDLCSLSRNLHHQQFDPPSSSDGAHSRENLESRRGNKKPSLPGTAEKIFDIDGIVDQAALGETSSNTAENKIDASDSRERLSHSEHITAFAKLLCFLTADLAYRYLHSPTEVTRSSRYIQVSCAVAMLDEQSGVSGSGTGAKKISSGRKSGSGAWASDTGMQKPGAENVGIRDFGDSGTASRFFYCAKPAKSDKGEGNIHPTVKSIELMTYFIKLVTPPGGTVLDPFMGSGSTGVAAVQLDMQFIGIEKELEYFAIAKKRITGS